MEYKKFTATKEQEGRYLPLEIDIQDIERLDIRYSYQRHLAEVSEDRTFEDEIAIVDFSIIAPNEQYLGSSGSNREHLYFSELGSSAGFERPLKMEGTWTILVGAYKVPEEGLEVTYELTYTEKEYRWFKGDTHMHSTASDGQLRTETLVNVAKDMGLDYIIMTDHNNYHPEAAYLSSEQMTIIPGVEWTQYNGHGNFLNLDRPLMPSFVTTTDDGLHDMIQKGHDQGALFVINHPFCPNVPWKWTMDVDYDAIEIINGGTDPRANLKAIAWWHEQLVKGRRIPVIGGSDFHRFDRFHSLGAPTTHLYAKSKSRGDILDAIKSGAAYITTDVNGPQLEIETSDGVHLGGVMQAGETIKTTIRHLKAGYFIKLIDDKSQEIIRIDKDTKEVQITQTTQDKQFIRMEIWDGESIVSVKGIQSNLLLVSNPIYIQ